MDFDPLSAVRGFDDLKRFPPFEDEWLRGGPVRRWIPAPYQDRPLYVFETGGTTGIPKSRTSVDDFRIDYELFSAVLSDEHFPPGSNWLMLGPSGPRRLRLAVEHLAQFRGGIAFGVDLDPRWVIKLIKKGWTEHLLAYQAHVIDQALTVLSAGHRHPVPLHDPEAIGGALPAARGRGADARGDGNPRHLLGGHRVHPAVDTVRHGRAASTGSSSSPPTATR